MKTATNQKIWLFGRSIDLGFLFLPVWLIWLVCFLLPESSIESEMPVWVWLVFVVGIDVSHVWSTIFRTYTDREEFTNHRTLLLLAPVISFLVFFLVSGVSQPPFWRILAYVALYHFIKQQYGFMRIYKAKARDFKSRWIKDEWVVYAGMLYPVVYWHLTDVRNFSWFVEGDFLNYYHLLATLPLDQIFGITNVLYWLFIFGWLVQETFFQRQLYWGKVLWVLSTAVNWYLGIVYFNSDLVFTITNVVAHGIPYLVLVLFYVEKKKRTVRSQRRTIVKGSLAVFTMVLVVLLLAFGEEYMWDMLIYRENVALFETILAFPANALSGSWSQAFGIALLTVPQATHYIIDGFIWKSNAKNPHLKRILLDE